MQISITGDGRNGAATASGGWRGIAALVTAIGLLAGSGPSAEAFTYHQLYQFKGASSDGSYPLWGSLTYGNGKLYGTTAWGGSSGYGTVYSINTDGTGEQVLHSFKGGPDDGGGGSGSLVLLKGKLYGGAYLGGSGPCPDVGEGPGCGTIYSLNIDGRKYKTLYSFQNSTDGHGVQGAGLMYDKSTDALYGTTDDGGQNFAGTVFSIKPDGTNFSVVWPSDVAPNGGLLKVKGRLYGTGSAGTCGSGDIYSLKLDGSDPRIEWSSCGQPDGYGPLAPLINVKGVLYTTTTLGGPANANCPHGCGTVISFDLKSHQEKVIYAFQGHPDGSFPGYAGVTYNPSDDRLYGTTQDGGTGSCAGQACGTIYSMTLKGKDEKILYSFKGGADGWYPRQGLVLVNGTFYGTTAYGGVVNPNFCVFQDNTCGTIFSFTP